MSEDGGRHVGSVSVEVVPDARGFKDKTKAQIGDVEVRAKLNVDDDKAKAELDEATRDREVKVRARVDKNSMQDVSALGTALLALAPAVAPVGAAAVAAGAALGAMGGAGILAIKGIQAEMASGDAVGRRYSNTLAALGGDLSMLEKTAARGVLSGFTAAAHDAESAMPALNSEVSILSKDLGSVLAPATSGVLGLFKDLNPVMNGLAGGAGHVAQEFSGWANGPGGRAFATYMATELPQVGAAVQALAGAGEHAVQALLPLGGPVLHGIEGVSDAISHIPLPILTDTFAVFGGYKLITLATKEVQSFTSALVKLGIVQEAVSAGGGSGVAGAGGKAAGGTKGGLLGAGAGLLARIGVPEIASSVGGYIAGGVGVGILGAQLIDAHQSSLNNAAATKIVKGGAPALSAARGQLAGYNTQLSTISSGLAAQAGHGGITMNQAQGTAAAYSALQGKADNLSAAIGLASKAMQANAAANVKLGLTADGTRIAVTGESVALANLVTTQDKAAGVAQGLVGANIAYHQSIADANAALKANGKTLDLNTAKGRANAGALLDLANKARGNADAAAAAGKSQAVFTGDLDAGRNALIKMAEKFGDTEAAAKAYADKLLGIPKKVSTTIQLHIDAAAAQNKLNDLLAHLPEASLSGVQLSGGSSKKGPGKAYGGEIFGPGGPRSDDILTPLSPGEFVIKADAAKAFGYGALAAINSGHHVMQPMPVGPPPNYISAYSAKSAAATSHPLNATRGGYTVNLNGDIVAADPDAAVRKVAQQQRQAYQQYQLAGV